jgi:hypothetical protein
MTNKEAKNWVKLHKEKLQEYQFAKLTLKDSPSLVIMCNLKIKWCLKRLLSAIDTYELKTQDNRYNSLRPFISLQLKKLAQ